MRRSRDSVCRVFVAGVLAAAFVTLMACGGAAPESDTTSEVRIEPLSFGLGRVARPNSWVGVRLLVTDPSAQARDLVIRCVKPDPDGDELAYETRMTASPVGSEVWLPIRFDRELSGSTVVRITAHVFDEDAERGLGREVGNVVFSPDGSGGRLRSPGVVTADHKPLMGLIGSRDVALGGYDDVLEPDRAEWRAFGHDSYEFANLQAETLASSWLCYEPFDVIVWRRGDPSRVTAGAARALISWVRRGGRFIVMAPSDAQAWTDTQRNPLAGILPAVQLTPRRTTGSELAGLLGSQARASFPGYTLGALSGVDPSDAEVVLTDDAGDAIVVRRAIGAGSVTLVGIDPRGAQAEGFWHRVLGDRGLIVTTGQAAQISQQNNITNLADRTPHYVDDWIADEINLSGRAAGGLGFALVVFGVFWVVAGPLGYLALRMRRMQRHAWLLFFATSLLFAVGSWGGAIALRPIDTDADHVTIVTEVYGRTGSRMDTWLSLLTPVYGDLTLSLGTSETSRGWITPWAPRDDRSPSFPDLRSYAIDTLAPASLRFPIRATAKQFRASWSGESSGLSMPRPVLPPGVRGDPRLRLDDNGLTGSLQHDLPGTLVNTRVVLVSRQRDIPLVSDADPGAQVDSPLTISAGRVLAVGEWAPGSRLDLDGYFEAPFLATELSRDLDTLTPRVSGGLDVTIGDVGEDRMLQAALFPHIGRPTPSSFGGQNGPAVCRRSDLLGTDLGEWLTRPCLIVVGELEGSETPLPLELGGTGELPSSGKTVIRWVYPLEPDPPSWRSR